MKFKHVFIAGMISFSAQLASASFLAAGAPPEFAEYDKKMSAAINQYRGAAWDYKHQLISDEAFDRALVQLESEAKATYLTFAEKAQKEGEEGPLFEHMQRTLPYYKIAAVDGWVEARYEFAPRVVYDAYSRTNGFLILQPTLRQISEDERSPFYSAMENIVRELSNDLRKIGNQSRDKGWDVSQGESSYKLYMSEIENVNKSLSEIRAKGVDASRLSRLCVHARLVIGRYPSAGLLHPNVANHEVRAQKYQELKSDLDRLCGPAERDDVLIEFGKDDEYYTEKFQTLNGIIQSKLKPLLVEVRRLQLEKARNYAQSEQDVAKQAAEVKRLEDEIAKIKEK